MSGPAFRFLHTSDWNLERPVYGVNEVPDHLREALIDAPFKAAKQVCDAALTEGVDFVILSGEITHPIHGGPRALDFLYQQFELLHRKQVAVYWVAGGSDRPEMWPGSLPLPASVQTFPTDRIRSITARRGDRTLAKIQGCSHPKDGKVRAGDFSRAPGQFTIAAVHGTCNLSQLRRSRIDYWALGGRRTRETVFSSPRIAQYCGSPQGRSMTELGPHGCTLVDVDEMGVVSRQMIPTDVVRWHHENLELPDLILLKKPH